LITDRLIVPEAVMEWRRGRAYGQDLRDKMFAAIDRGIEPVEVAETFTVSVSWIYKALGRRRATGETTARPQRCHVAGKLDLHHDAIRARVAAVPDMTIAELRDWLRAARGISVSHAVMWETLKRLGLSLKKRPSMPPNRNAPMSPLRARTGVSCSPS
jgi:transposase